MYAKTENCCYANMQALNSTSHNFDVQFRTQYCVIIGHLQGIALYFFD